jgi:transcriptional regulator with XRE-family HTH domain
MDRVMQNIKKRRKELGITQAQLASEIGVVQNYYSALETGRNRLNVEQLELIAKALNCSPGDFFCDSGIKDCSKPSFDAIVELHEDNMGFNKTARMEFSKDMPMEMIKEIIDYTVKTSGMSTDIPRSDSAPKPAVVGGDTAGFTTE